MDKRSDALLRRLLKKWVNRLAPPDEGRARLLWEVAHAPRNKIDLDLLLFRPQFKSYTSSSTSEWTQTLFTWINENSFQVGLKARLI